MSLRLVADPAVERDRATVLLGSLTCRGSPLDRFAPLFEGLMIHNGGDPCAGRHRVSWLQEAGLEVVAVSASYDCWTPTPEETRRNADFLAALVGRCGFASQLVEAGLADPATLTRMSNGFIDWGRRPRSPIFGTIRCPTFGAYRCPSFGT